MAKTTSKSKTAYYAMYKANKVWEKNRAKRLARTIKNQPNNEQAKAAMKAGFVYRRKTPVTPAWSSSWRRVAAVFVEFTGSFNRDIMSSNPKTASEALQRPGTKSAGYATSQKVDFSLGARLQGNR
jgi:hypothetical protein